MLNKTIFLEIDLSTKKNWLTLTPNWLKQHDVKLPNKI